MKKLIPPYLFMICIVAMIVSNSLMDSFTYCENHILTIIIGVLVFIIGFTILYLANSKIKKNKTEIHTFKKPNILLTNGIFKLSRNPIYLGFLIILTSLTLYLNNYLLLSYCLIFFGISNSWYIPFEEKKLVDEFGNEYLKYKKKVRRWI